MVIGCYIYSYVVIDGFRWLEVAIDCHGWL